MGGGDRWLLELPDLVVELLLTFLDVESLIHLRLTCTTTKGWVERQKSLQRLQLTLRSEHDLNSLIDVKANKLIPWTNICFLWDDVFNRPRALPKFIAIYAQLITKLDFSKTTPDDTLAINDSIVDLLLACTKIVSIQICELSCLTLSRKNGLETLIRNWKCLQSLHIKHILCPEYHGLDYFSRLLLEGCKTLIELDPPTITLTSPEYLSFNYKLYFKLHIVQPILQVLENKSSLKKLYIQEHLFDGDPGLLFHLAQSCVKSNTILHPETFLPFSRSMFMQVPKSESSLFSILGRLCGINDLVLCVGRAQPLQNLTFLSVSFRSFFVSDDVLESFASHPPLLHLPRLEEVEIEMTNDPPWEGRPHKLSTFMQCLCKTPYRSVTKLVLMEISRANDTTLIRATDVVVGFPSLSKLEISNWDGGNGEFDTLWKGLPCLEEVKLRFCHLLGDEGTLGMVGLQRLRVLIINDVGPLTDDSYRLVFRHLHLRSFYHYCSSGCLVTRKGYNSLATGVFRNSIRQLLLQNSNEFRTMDQFCNFLAQFPKLRRPQFDEARRSMARNAMASSNRLSSFHADHENQSCCAIN